MRFKSRVVCAPLHEPDGRQRTGRILSSDCCTHKRQKRKNVSSSLQWRGRQDNRLYSDARVQTTLAPRETRNTLKHLSQIPCSPVLATCWKSSCITITLEWLTDTGQKIFWATSPMEWMGISSLQWGRDLVSATPRTWHDLPRSTISQSSSSAGSGLEPFGSPQVHHSSE